LFNNESHDVGSAVACIQQLSCNPAEEVISNTTNLVKGSTPLEGEL